MKIVYMTASVSVYLSTQESNKPHAATKDSSQQLVRIVKIQNEQSAIACN